jgi:hypothetical protein
LSWRSGYSSSSVTATASDTVTLIALRPNNTMKTIATRPNHTSGGEPIIDSSVNETMPARLPSRSYRYASSRGSVRKQPPTISAGPAVIAATDRKTPGSTSQIGGPEVPMLVKKTTWVDSRSTVTG